LAIPTWNVGDVLTASDVNTWFVPMTARKGSDQLVTSSTALVDDADLLVTTLAINAAYDFELLLNCTGAAIGTGDVKVAMVWPSGAAGEWYGLGFATSGASPTISHMETSSGAAHAFGIDGAGQSPVRITGSVRTVLFGGTLKLQWAQNSSSGTSTKVLKDSVMKVWRT
jgi:hypothetical protein